MLSVVVLNVVMLSVVVPMPQPLGGVYTDDNSVRILAFTDNENLKKVKYSKSILHLYEEHVLFVSNQIYY